MGSLPEGSWTKSSLFKHLLAVVAKFCHEGKVVFKRNGRHFLEANDIGICVMKEEELLSGREKLRRL
jgi:hypothetical protein